MKRLAAVLVLCALPVFCQTNSGQLNVKVTDPSGLGLKATVRIASDANQYRIALSTNDQGALIVQRLPYGIYQLKIDHAGFAPFSESVEIHSSIPVTHAIQLKLPAVNETITVSAPNTLIDPDRAGSINHIGPRPHREPAELRPRSLLAGFGEFAAGLAL